MTRSKILAPVVLLGSLIGAPALAAENPMGRIGSEQNAYVDCLMAKGTTSSIASLDRVVAECGYDHGIGAEEFVKLYSPLVGTDPLLPSAQRLASHEGVFTSYEFSFLERSDLSLYQAGGYAAAEEAIAKLEQEAIAKLDPKAESSRALLSGLSAARSSLRYWSQRSVPYRYGGVIAASAMMGGVIGDGGAGVAAAASVGAFDAAKAR